MSLISYHEIHRNGSGDVKGIFHYIRILRVIVDEQKEDPGDVASYIPTYFYITTWDSNPYAYLKKKEARQVSVSEDGGAVWEVTEDYNNETTDTGQTDTSVAAPSGAPGQMAQTVQPDLRPPTLDIDSVEVQELRDEDYSAPAKKLKASNGQPFVPPLTTFAYHPLLTFTIFKAIGSDSFANTVTYTGKVNTALWNGFAANTLLCRKYKLTTQFEFGAWWWLKTVVIEVKEDGWNPLKILDAGTYERYSSMDPTKPYRPIRVNGMIVTSPVPLDGLGRALAPNAAAVYLEFKQYKTQAFTNIL